MSVTVPVDRQGLQVLTLEECLVLVAQSRVGRVGFVVDGEPMIVPVNHLLDGRTVVFRTAPGSKLHAAARGAPFAFQVDAASQYGRQGWSVLVRGTAEEIVDDREIDRLQSLGLDSWADAVARSRWVRIRPNEISGRRIFRGGVML